MNEQRIREIANQASDHAENTVEYFPDTEDGLDYPAKMMKVRDLKFAELIVGECVKKCEFVAAMAEITNTGEMARKTKATANSCAQMIEQHFGVEE
jgi:hypothetical protein